MPDLLPPYPTVTTTPQKFFPTPSPLAAAPMAPNLSALSSTTISPNPHPEDIQAAFGPPIKPLDLSRMDTDEVFVALEGVVEDMTAWLGVVEGGLDELLRVTLDGEGEGNGAGAEGVPA